MDVHVCLMASLKGWEEALPWSRQSHQGLFCMQRLCLRACGWNTQTTTTISVCSVPTAGEKRGAREEKNTMWQSAGKRKSNTMPEVPESCQNRSPHTPPTTGMTVKEEISLSQGSCCFIHFSIHRGDGSLRIQLWQRCFRPRNRWINTMARFQVQASYINVNLHS